MASDVITTAIIAVAALIILSALLAALFPQVFEAAGSIGSVAGTANDRVKTSAVVVNHDHPAAGQLKFDVMNDGQNSLGPTQINQSVAYLNNDTAPNNILQLGTGGGSQYWSYTITGQADGSWDPDDVLVVSVANPGGGFASGEYQFRMLLNNGAIIQYRFTI